MNVEGSGRRVQDGGLTEKDTVLGVGLKFQELGFEDLIELAILGTARHRGLGVLGLAVAEALISQLPDVVVLGIPKGPSMQVYSIYLGPRGFTI